MWDRWTRLGLHSKINSISRTLSRRQRQHPLMEIDILWSSCNMHAKNAFCISIVAICGRIPAKCLPKESMGNCVRGACRCMKFPTDAEIQFQSKIWGPLIPVRVRTVIRLWGSPTHIRIPTHIRTDGIPELYCESVQKLGVKNRDVLRFEAVFASDY